MHWQIGSGGFHHAAAEEQKRPLRCRSSAGSPSRRSERRRRCPRMFPSCCSRRSRSASAMTRSLPSALIRCRPMVPRSAGRAPRRGTVRRSLRLGHRWRTTIRLRVESVARRRDAIFPPPWSVSRDRRISSSATSSRRCCTLPSRSCHAGCATSGRGLARPISLLAVGGGRAAALQARGDGRGIPHPGRGPVVAHQAPAPALIDRPMDPYPRRPGRERKRADFRTDLYVRQPVDGQPRLRRPARSTRGARAFSGRRPELPESFAGPPPPGIRDVRLLPRLPGPSRRRPTRERPSKAVPAATSTRSRRTCRRGLAARGPDRRRGARHEERVHFLWDHLHALRARCRLNARPWS